MQLYGFMHPFNQFVFMNLLGITGGSTLVALGTDYLFQDDVAVGYSMSIIASASGPTGALLLFLGLKHFRRTVEEHLI
jgi:hypothetical protein